MSFSFIIFDLDNTLYSHDTGVMKEIGRRIQVWLCEQLDLTWQEAVDLRKHYLQRHGTTMGGLMAEHDVEVNEYLDFVHDIRIEDYLAPDPELQRMLEAIPLRKAIYTNATSMHGRRVLDALDVADQFERVIGIEDVGLRNKINRDAYEEVLALLDAEGEACVMVEDSPRNLPAAKAVGMTTILILAEDGAAPVDVSDEWIDFEVKSVLEVGRVVDQLVQRA